MAEILIRGFGVSIEHLEDSICAASVEGVGGVERLDGVQLRKAWKELNFEIGTGKLSESGVGFGADLAIGIVEEREEDGDGLRAMKVQDGEEVCAGFADYGFWMAAEFEGDRVGWCADEKHCGTGVVERFVVLANGRMLEHEILEERQGGGSVGAKETKTDKGELRWVGVDVEVCDELRIVEADSKPLAEIIDGR